MEQAIALDTPLPFKDRKTGLVVFGILEILAGALCVLLVPLLFLGQAMNSRVTGTEPNYRLALPGVMVYAMMAVVFLMLGIGSIRARRWARACCLILGWSWLLIGCIAVVVYAFLLPRILSQMPPGAPNLPGGARLLIMLFAMAFMVFFFVLIPLALVLFYQNQNVLATCEARDPVARWTDRCPLPVLALSLWLGSGALSMFLMPVAYHGVVPLFGTLVSGPVGLVFYLCMAGLFFYLARATYQLNPLAWWIVLGVMLLFGISNLLTFGRIDLSEMYRLMGYPEAQIRQMQQLNLLGNNFMLLSSALGCLPLIGYLIYIRRYFRPPYAASA